MKKAKTTIQVLLISAAICFIAPETKAVTFDDGGTHNIDYTINDNVTVMAEETFWEKEETTMNLLSGGLIGNSVRAYDNSQIHIFGGSVRYDLYAYEGCYVDISGGSIADRLETTDNSQAYISGGSIDGWLKTSGYSHVSISDGTVAGELHAEQNSQVDVSGGTLGHEVYSEGNSRVNISGGLETGNPLHAWDSSVFTIYGSYPVSYGWGGACYDESNLKMVFRGRYRLFLQVYQGQTSKQWLHQAFLFSMYARQS